MALKRTVTHTSSSHPSNQKDTNIRSKTKKRNRQGEGGGVRAGSYSVKKPTYETPRRIFLTKPTRLRSKRYVDNVELKVLFLHKLIEFGTVAHAAAHAGIGRSTAQQWRKRDPYFAKDWENCYQDVADVLEASAYARALAGDTTLTIFLLKALRPDKYREKPQDNRQVIVLPGQPITAPQLRQVQNNAQAKLPEGRS